MVFEELFGHTWRVNVAKIELPRPAFWLFFKLFLAQLWFSFGFCLQIFSAFLNPKPNPSTSRAKSKAGFRGLQLFKWLQRCRDHKQLLIDFPFN